MVIQTPQAISKPKINQNMKDIIGHTDNFTVICHGANEYATPDIEIKYVKYVQLYPWQHHFSFSFALNIDVHLFLNLSIKG